MSNYRAPLRDIRFVLSEALRIQAHYDALGRSDVSADILDSVLTEAASFTEEIIAPLNASGDAEGAQHRDGRVATPVGFADAYRKFMDAGWPAIGAPERFGGQGLPASLEFPIVEMLSGANLAWRTYSGLSAGSIALLGAHADDALQARYVPKLVSGEWLPTMCLTEPQCGTDLALIRTRAEPADDGTFRITGSKIFITGGEHDLTPNIVHLVLARLPDAPAGSRGISLFLAPKFLDEARTIRNGVACTSIEHKMGIRGSATCALSFESAQAWLIGAPHAGLAGMFTMMNHARLAVGVQGLGVAQYAFQRALAYAQARKQGRASSQTPPTAADPILVHADVRRMLLTQQALVEGCRMLAYYTAMQMDRAHSLADAQARRDAEARVAVLTPITKAFITDAAVECAGLAVQIHGGHGYVREMGVEQLLRDARILPIYEGTNGVQAADLLGRKVLADEARAVTAMIAEIRRCADELEGSAPLRLLAASLRESLQEWTALNNTLRAAAQRDAEEVGAAAHDYLQFAGHVLLAWCWARMAACAASRASTDAYYRSKIAAAEFFFARLLPRAGAHAAAARAGAASIAPPSLLAASC